jgi:hypothetical protein
MQIKSSFRIYELMHPREIPADGFILKPIASLGNELKSIEQAKAKIQELTPKNRQFVILEVYNT